MDQPLSTAVRTYYKGICQYCGAGGADHVDHITPHSSGGADDLTNVTLACRSCNLRKSATRLDPMFLAIAHARAQDSAERIRALRPRLPASPKLPPADPFGPKSRRKLIRLYGEEEAERRMEQARAIGRLDQKRG